MNDRTDQPASVPGAVAYELMLEGDPTLPDDPGDARSGHEKRPVVHNLIVGLAVLVGLCAVGFTIVWVWDDDPDDDAPSAEPTAEDDASSASPITTPSTLPPLDTIPPVATEPPRAPIGEAAPVREGSLLDEVDVPTMPLVVGDIDPPPGSFDLAAAVAQLDGDLARRSSTRLELGVGGYIREYTIVRDPGAGRYALNFGGLMSIADESSGLSYVDVSSFDEEQWVTLETGEIADSFGVDQAGVLYDEMLRGPLRPDTLGAATVTAGELVILPVTETVARAFEIELPGSTIPEWQLYAFGPTDEFAPADRPDRLTYSVYVTENNQIGRIVGLSDLGGIPQLVVHDIETLTEPISIELPDPNKVIPGSPLTAD